MNPQRPKESPNFMPLLEKKMPWAGNSEKLHRRGSSYKNEQKNGTKVERRCRAAMTLIEWRKEFSSVTDCHLLGARVWLPPLLASKA
jgi:hypothetical protein